MHIVNNVKTQKNTTQLSIVHWVLWAVYWRRSIYCIMKQCTLFVMECVR